MTEIERLRAEGTAAWRDWQSAMTPSVRLKWEKWAQLVLQIASEEAKGVESQ